MAEIFVGGFNYLIALHWLALIEIALVHSDII